LDGFLFLERLLSEEIDLCGVELNGVEDINGGDEMSVVWSEVGSDFLSIWR
jgi:hypothetical protein